MTLMTSTGVFVGTPFWMIDDHEDSFIMTCQFIVGTHLYKYSFSIDQHIFRIQSWLSRWQARHKHFGGVMKPISNQNCVLFEIIVVQLTMWFGNTSSYNQRSKMPIYLMMSRMGVVKLGTRFISEKLISKCVTEINGTLFFSNKSPKFYFDC